MSDRYKKMFSALALKGEGAFIPFMVLGDPDRETSLKIMETLIEAGADALELGLPFSDPIADGPIIQAASQRALKAGVKVSDCFEMIQQFRDTNSDIPIGLLVYANLVEAAGAKAFYAKAAKAGVDSVLIADAPYNEIERFSGSAKAQGVKTVLILPLDSGEERVESIAGKSEGYLYLLSRKGVTGVETGAGFPTPQFIRNLTKIGSAPPVLGFGISTPNHVRRAIKAGCRGVISGSAVVEKMKEIEKRESKFRDLTLFIKEMKKATLVA